MSEGDVRGLAVPAPRDRHAAERGKPMSATEAGERSIRHAAKWGPAGFLALGAMLLCAGGAYAIGKNGWSESGSTAAHWTQTDQIRFEAANNQRLEKLERVIERMDTLLVSQSKTVDRILTLYEKQDDRIKALEANVAPRAPR